MASKVFWKAASPAVAESNSVPSQSNKTVLIDPLTSLTLRSRIPMIPEHQQVLENWSSDTHFSRRASSGANPHPGCTNHFRHREIQVASVLVASSSFSSAYRSAKT